MFQSLRPGYLCFVVIATTLHGQNSVPAPLPSEETLNYGIEWRLITAGKANLLWSANPTHGSQVKVHIESTGLVSKLFRVNDDYSGNFNPSLCAISTELNAQEGNRHRETKISFDPDKKKAVYLEQDLVKKSVMASHEIEIPACVHDVIGGLYHLRTINLDVGQSTQMPVSDGKKSVSARIEAQRREEVKTPAGTHKAIRYEVFLFNNVLYKRSGHLYVWLTDDRQRLPVQLQIRLQFTIGTVTLRLEKQRK
jgi:hypothetical protein